jgi:DNA-binding MarR family transcriptional regulator
MGLLLTRPQRQVYLLVDGARTIADLARALHKTGPQIEQLLTELEQRGLVELARSRGWEWGQHAAPTQGALAAGRERNTEPLSQQALDEQPGASHPDAALSLTRLAERSRAQGRHEEAKALLQRAVEIAEVSLGREHPQTRQIRASYWAFLDSLLT